MSTDGQINGTGLQGPPEEKSGPTAPIVMAGQLVVLTSNVAVGEIDDGDEGDKMLVIEAPDHSLQILVPLPKDVAQVVGRNLLGLDPKLHLGSAADLAMLRKQQPEG